MNAKRQDEGQSPSWSLLDRKQQEMSQDEPDLNRHQAILNAARAVLDAKGYADATVEDIAAGFTPSQPSRPWRRKTSGHAGRSGRGSALPCGWRSSTSDPTGR